ncbi:hypothetical protein FIE12Z_5251 [Fusarium flagelliforme]|uniref:Uncharacterized protein n=1 Tax=Fusarium flagelliforme TaxID=2675880 RepID=A0A395MR89_9HYPO|nr:hypothetical protein FIE12Z_5251 [Fusarium flagelliforme]
MVSNDGSLERNLSTTKAMTLLREVHEATMGYFMPLVDDVVNTMFHDEAATSKCRPSQGPNDEALPALTAGYTPRHADPPESDMLLALLSPQSLRATHPCNHLRIDKLSPEPLEVLQPGLGSNERSVEAPVDGAEIASSNDRMSDKAEDPPLLGPSDDEEFKTDTKAEKKKDADASETTENVVQLFSAHASSSGSNNYNSKALSTLLLYLHAAIVLWLGAQVCSYLDLKVKPVWAGAAVALQGGPEASLNYFEDPPSHKNSNLYSSTPYPTRMESTNIRQNLSITNSPRMSKRNHDQFLDSANTDIAEATAMDALMKHTIKRIEDEKALLGRQERTAALYRKRDVLKQEVKSLREQLNSAQAKAERLNGEYMSWLNGVIYSREPVKNPKEKLAPLSEAADECIRKASQLNAKILEGASISREIKLLKEKDTKGPTSDDAQELSANSHD